MSETKHAQVSFDKQAEAQQIEWRRKDRWGRHKRIQYEHILPPRDWLLAVWGPIRRELVQYIEGSGIQPNTNKHNLKSSWTQCANLFFPFRARTEMAPILAGFLSRELGLRVNGIESIELEYAAPGNLEPRRLLGETGGSRGAGQTSPDVAVLFDWGDGNSGIFLVENKYTEHYFYPCSASKKTLDKAHKERGLEVNPDPSRCLDIQLILDNPDEACHQYTWGRRYWDLLNRVVNKEAMAKCCQCPAKDSGYQLFRQQALAQGIAESGLFNLVVSGVAYDARNEALKTCLNEVGISNFTEGWADLFKGTVRFSCFTHQELVSYVCNRRSQTGREWAQYMTERYNYRLSP